MEVLKVSNLSIDFKTESGIVHAVKNLSFSLSKGEKLAIVGESGSGKSVSSLAIMGLLPSKITLFPAGEIQFQQQSVLGLSEKEHRKIRGSEIAMIFQEPMTSLNPLLKCGEQVSEAIRLHEQCSKEEANMKTITLFERVQLPRPKEIVDSYPHEISGGQKQRVMIAMAVACKPSLLIADEPTTALDVTVQGEILSLINDLVDEYDMACIFITHDLGVVHQFADEVLVMYRGEVIEEGSVEQVFNVPAQAYTKGLIACRPTLDTTSERLATVSDFLKETVKETTENTSKIKKEGEVLLAVKNISVDYVTATNWLGKPTAFVNAVQDVSFELKKGETIGLVGESGCGKTTIGRAILGLEKIASGDVLFEGKNVTHLSSSERKEYWKKAQIIFQDPYSSLNPRLSIGEAILEPMVIHGIGGSNVERRNRVIELLETVGLTADQYDRFPHEFSGGQRQRICIARTLAMEPSLIICDESVSALDVSVQAQVLNLLNDLKDQFELTYLFISHDLSVVKYMSDRIVVMKSGTLIEQGTADEIYKNPKQDYTKMLLDAIPA